MTLSLSVFYKQELIDDKFCRFDVLLTCLSFFKLSDRRSRQSRLTVGHDELTQIFYSLVLMYSYHAFCFSAASVMIGSSISSSIDEFSLTHVSMNSLNLSETF